MIYYRVIIYSIFNYIWVIYGIHVSKYAIHGASGIYYIGTQKSSLSQSVAGKPDKEFNTFIVFFHLYIYIYEWHRCLRFRSKFPCFSVTTPKGTVMPSKPHLGSEVGWTSMAVLVPSLWEEAVFCAELAMENMGKLWTTK